MKLFLLITLSILLIFTQTSYADDSAPLVKVNLIVFQQSDAQKAQSSEDWPNHIAMPFVRNSLLLKPFQPPPTALNASPKQTPPVPATPQSASPTPGSKSTTTKNPYQYNGTSVFTLLPPAQVGLDNIVQQLQDNDYTILLNTAWVQPAIQNRRWLHIKSNQAFNALGQLFNTQQNTTNTNTIPNPQTNTPVAFPVDGLMRVSYNRFFNVQLNLYLTTLAQLSDQFDVTQYHFLPLRTYRLTGYHRIKAGQMLYVDHPMYGVLVLISKVN